MHAPGVRCDWNPTLSSPKAISEYGGAEAPWHGCDCNGGAQRRLSFCRAEVAGPLPALCGEKEVRAPLHADARPVDGCGVHEVALGERISTSDMQPSYARLAVRSFSDDCRYDKTANHQVR
jgi:hypothetical protein